MSGYLPAITEKDQTRIIQAIRDLSQGRSNATGEFTLAAGETSTTVIALNCGEESKIAITPRTANAAAVLTTTYITAANTTRGQFIVSHASSAEVDLTFAYAISG